MSYLVKGNQKICQEFPVQEKEGQHEEKSQGNKIILSTYLWLLQCHHQSSDFHRQQHLYGLTKVLSTKESYSCSLYFEEIN